MSHQVRIIRDMPHLVQELLAFGEDGREMWYRGHKYHDYYLEPSAYRYKKFHASSYDIETDSIMAAKSELLHISETHQLGSNLNWLCYLQHNRFPTRLLDWTFEFQVALYFAFEDHLQKKADAGSLPCLWALRPGAFMECMGEYIVKNKAARPFGVPTKLAETLVEKIYKDKQPKDTTYITVYEAENKEALDDLYVPFFAPFVNERAKLQGGCFIRYPMLDGVNVQQPFINHRLENFVDATPGFDNCLVKFVFLHPNKMKDDLSMLNLRTSRIYPEVENLTLGIKKRFFEN